MKHIIFNKLAAIVILTIFFGGCINTVNQEQPNSEIFENSFDLGPKDINGRAIHRAFKGIELYSWQNESEQWCFSLMLGTNRNKSYSKVIAPELTIVGFAQLKIKLGTLAKGEYVSWINGTYDQPEDAMPKLILPPEDVIKQIIDYNKKQEINLSITNRYTK